MAPEISTVYLNCGKTCNCLVYNAVMHPKDTDEMANSGDPDQTAPKRSSLIWVSTVCPDWSAQYLEFLLYIEISEQEK